MGYTKEQLNILWHKRSSFCLSDGIPCSEIDAVIQDAIGKAVEIARLRETQEDVCIWNVCFLDYGEGAYWETKCGDAYQFEGTLSENDYNYCPKCGKKILEVLPQPPEEE